MPWKNLLTDTKWAERGGRPALQIGLTTFGILALELALIRWTSGQVRAFAYFSNVVLITAFLGMGCGVALGARRPGLVHGTLPVLAVVALPLALADPLGLVHLTFPDPSIMLWGSVVNTGSGLVFTRNIALFLALLAGIGVVFACAGSALGHLFGRTEVLRAYAADLGGSLLGVLAFTLLAWVNAGPVAWLALGALPFAWLSRRWWSAACLVTVLGLAAFSSRTALYSPYNRIDLTQEWPALSLAVNRDFHQYLHDLSDARLADPALSEADRGNLRLTRALYDLPFTINPARGSAVIVGAGTGNDVQAARRAGYGEITSVDIDARILAIGRERHPEQPYSDPRVHQVNDDARAFFRTDPEKKYDVVCFGLLDSHAMASAMSSLRLDNYVYTEEGIRSAWQHVAPGGHLSLAMSCPAGEWFFRRLYWTIRKATGREPIAVFSPLHGWTSTYIVPGPEAHLDVVKMRNLALIAPTGTMAETNTTSDDWPFLYLQAAVVPWGYLLVLGSILATALALARPVFGVGGGGVRFDWPLFFMGAAFLLIETRGVTSLALLFGSTWVVNSAVFAGVLVMVLLANFAVLRRSWTNPGPWFAALFASVMLLWWLPVQWLGGLPILARGVAGGLATGLPIGLAGVIVPMLLKRSANPAASLGANLIGAVLGGCLEYLSMYAGLRSVALLALVLYLLAFVAQRRELPGAA